MGIDDEYGVRVGPAGWSYADWKGIVYPPEVPRGRHPLSLLSSWFDMVEVNATFYRPANWRHAAAWVEEVGGNGLARTESQTTIESDVFELDNVLYYLTRSREGNDFLYEFVDHDNKYQSVLLAETVKGYSKKFIEVKSAKKKTR